MGDWAADTSMLTMRQQARRMPFLPRAVVVHSAATQIGHPRDIISGVVIAACNTTLASHGVDGVMSLCSLHELGGWGIGGRVVNRVVIKKNSDK